MCCESRADAVRGSESGSCGTEVCRRCAVDLVEPDTSEVVSALASGSAVATGCASVWDLETGGAACEERRR